MSEPTKEYGWVMGVTDYKEGDQHWRWGRWSDCDVSIGSKCTLVRRRKIDPGEGFEIVPYGAIINAGDQRFIDGEWREFIYSIGKPIRTFHAVRRPIPRLSASPWVKFGERLPEAHKPIWVAYFDGELKCHAKGFSADVIPGWGKSQHQWQYATIPTPPAAPPPAPKRTREAEAFEIWEGQTINAQWQVTKPRPVNTPPLCPQCERNLRVAEWNIKGSMIEKSVRVVRQANTQYQVWFKVGVQSFAISGQWDTLAEANWCRKMVIHALRALSKS